MKISLTFHGIDGTVITEVEADFQSSNIIRQTDTQPDSSRYYCEDLEDSQTIKIDPIIWF